MRPQDIPEGESLWRERLANGRTTLSWVRTGSSMIGVGILLGVLSGLSKLPAGGPSATFPRSIPHGGEFLALGLALTAAGVVIEVAALVKFIRYGSEIERGRFTSSAPLYLLVSLGLVLLCIAFGGFLVLS